jgi:DNA-binding response OmpR family regulator
MHVRSSRPASPTGKVPDVIRDELLTVSLGEVSVANGKTSRLTPLEFKLLICFVRHPHEVLPYERLSELAWGASGATRDQIKLYVSYLRRKLRAAGADPIETVRGAGYRYRPSG